MLTKLLGLIAGMVLIADGLLAYLLCRKSGESTGGRLPPTSPAALPNTLTKWCR